MLGSKNRRCDDCGRTRTWENLLKVRWSWRADESDCWTESHLQLCYHCARVMSSANRGDANCTLEFRPI